MNTWRPGEGPGEFTPTGDLQQVAPERLDALDEVLEREYRTHLKMERHFWVVLMAHRGSDKLLDMWDKAVADPASPPTLDADTLLARPGMACYVCGAAYEPRLRRRKCLGENDQAGYL